MRYKGSHGKTVQVKADRDLMGNPIDKNLKHVITFYVDSDTEVVGIYPLYEDGYTKDDILSFEPVKHALPVDDLEEVLTSN